MKLIGRIIIIILLVLTVLISGFALLCALGVVGEIHISQISEAFYSNMGTRAVVATACIFVILITVLVALIRPKRNRNQSSQVLTSYDGSIKISHAAIAESVKSLAKKDKSTARVRVKTKETKEGLEVLIILTLHRGADIMAATKKIKKETEDFLVEQCGIKLAEVEVLLDRVIGKI
ncbi:MAG: alkaline shock response membrane anchor protein AmaP [Eubacteriales bacterium]